MSRMPREAAPSSETLGLAQRKTKKSGTCEGNVDSTGFLVSDFWFLIWKGRHPKGWTPNGTATFKNRSDVDRCCGAGIWDRSRSVGRILARMQEAVEAVIFRGRMECRYSAELNSHTRLPQAGEWWIKGSGKARWKDRFAVQNVVSF